MPFSDYIKSVKLPRGFKPSTTWSLMMGALIQLVKVDFIDKPGKVIYITAHKKAQIHKKKPKA